MLIDQYDIVVIDLRWQAQYALGHIPGALLMPLTEFESRLRELHQEDYILVYHSCGSCSKEAARLLVDNGFSHVYRLRGGIDSWEAQGLPTTSR